MSKESGVPLPDNRTMCEQLGCTHDSDADGLVEVSAVPPFDPDLNLIEYLEQGPLPQQFRPLPVGRVEDLSGAPDWEALFPQLLAFIGGVVVGLIISLVFVLSVFG